MSSVGSYICKIPTKGILFPLLRPLHTVEKWSESKLPPSFPSCLSIFPRDRTVEKKKKIHTYLLSLSDVLAAMKYKNMKDSVA